MRIFLRNAQVRCSVIGDSIPLQFFSVLTGLWLATSLLTGVQALNSQARESYARASQLIGGEPQKVLSVTQRRDFPAGTVSSDLRRAGWPVSPALQRPHHTQGSEDQRLTTPGHRTGVAAPRSTRVLAGQALAIEQSRRILHSTGQHLDFTANPASVGSGGERQQTNER
jgi:hypothetical protein